MWKSTTWFAVAVLTVWASLSLDCKSTTTGQSRSDLSTYVGLWSCRVETSRLQGGTLGDATTSRVEWQILEAGYDAVTVETRETGCTDTFHLENGSLTFREGDVCTVDGSTYTTQSSSLNLRDGLLTGTETVRVQSRNDDSGGTWIEKRQIACVARDATDAAVDAAGQHEDAGNVASGGSRPDSGFMTSAGGQSAQGGSSGMGGDGGTGALPDAGSDTGGGADAGGLSSTGGSGSGGSGGEVCSSCRGCCEEQYPQGARAYADLLATCTCMVCSAVCADELCAPTPKDPTPGGACDECVADANSSSSTALDCIGSITTDCAPDPGCYGFATCIALCL